VTRRPGKDAVVYGRAAVHHQRVRSVQQDHRHGAILVRNRTAFIEQLNAAIGDEERILVVASERARNSGAVPPRVLAGRFVHWFADFGSNPNLASACAAAALVSEFRPSVVVGLGGGSAMDVAKAARVLPSDIAAALEMVRSGLSLRRIQGRRGVPKVVVVPTLSGSGAEVTQFATLFHDGRKVSVDDAGVRPDIAIIDPSLAVTAPHLPTSAATLDAVCHAVESAWSRSATAVSRGHSERGLQHFAAVGWKTDGAYSLEDRYAMAAGAVSAGLAINLTRTTAAHASAYMLTVCYGIPHGVACALNMQWVARINVAASVIEPEVVAVVERSLGVAVADLPEYFRDRLSSAGWPTHLGSYGVDRRDLPTVAAEATHQARLRNNPVDLTAADVEDGLSTIL
jgi:alcohol dehydrogenase class IV